MYSAASRAPDYSFRGGSLMRTRRPFLFAFVLPVVFLFMAFSEALAVPQSAGSNGSGRSGSTVGTAGDQDNDPDLPAFLSSRIEKGDYLRLRNAEIDMRRGLPLVPQTLNARRDAIEQLDRQLMKSGGPGRGAKLLATFWSAIGPAPIPNGQTEIVTTAVSGRVTCIAVKPTNSNTVYVGTAQGGVYRSLNGGSTWTAIFDNASSLAIGAIAIAPSSPTTLYVG